MYVANIKKFLKYIGFILSFLPIFLFIFTGFACTPEIQPETIAQKGDMDIKSDALRIESPVFLDNGNIPVKYSCNGENVNPQLNMSGIPENAESLLLIVDDPDAPKGTWVHWIVFNINPETALIAENSVPSGSIEGMTDFGIQGYGGPCPPSGTHRYFFKLFALDNVLDLDSKAKVDDINKAIEGHVIESAELVGLYPGN